MLVIFRILFSIISLGLAGYGLITRNYEFQAYLTLFLGLTMLMMGIQEFQQNRKLMGWLLVLAFAFSLVVSIQSFILL
ncbi:YczI family protein [Planomicrobium sp. CPCC 101079]|uniref:YczI family protein n=1 Tax=Planomicrobium sp. CPCC 101079 TaxID=2599618 RepID=UPI0011B5F63F|nr:YczI family protein [Planomicrobium sp. CPCC 101079]TWT11152.1 DUF3953 domain-containing protein [Planomicrobium sp. CPCC 101079]